MTTDHGIYAEFKKEKLCKENILEGPLSKQGFYFSDKTLDGVKVYRQVKTVADRRNPPRGVFACDNNRLGGYGDYKIGLCYVPMTSVKILSDKGMLCLNIKKIVNELKSLHNYKGDFKSNRFLAKRNSNFRSRIGY